MVSIPNKHNSDDGSEASNKTLTWPWLNAVHETIRYLLHHAYWNFLYHIWKQHQVHGQNGARRLEEA